MLRTVLAESIVATSLAVGRRVADDWQRYSSNSFRPVIKARYGYSVSRSRILVRDKNT